MENKILTVPTAFEMTNDSEVFKNTELMTEGLFRYLLVIERKRMERSNRNFMLMLLDISALPNTPQRNEVTVPALADMLFIQTRDTDIKGWYASNKVIGVIFTEFDKERTKTIHAKMEASIMESLGAEQASKVQLSFFIFPDDLIHEKSLVREIVSVLYEGETPNRPMKRIASFFKRVIDIIGGLMGMLLFSPFFILIPIVIKCTSRGPVFFKQIRVGQYGKRFTVIKFRTMRPNNDADIHKKFINQFINDSSGLAAKGQFKIKNDPRVTWIGKLLRKTSLDEIPQFINVLCGDMSVVGPRPAIPYEIEEYNIWHRRRVFEVKPGITGIWQIKGRSRTDFNNMVRMDIQYIRKWTPLLDLRIIAETPLALLSAKGAY